MTDMLSTAETTKLVNTTIPVHLDGTQISDEGTLAYLAGALHQAELFYERTGAFENIWRHGVAVSGSKTAVDSFDAVYFASGIVTDNSSNEYSFKNPCPPTAERRDAYDAVADVARTPKFTAAVDAATGGDKVDVQDFTVNPFKIKSDDRDFAHVQGIPCGGVPPRDREPSSRPQPEPDRRARHQDD